MTVRDYLKLAVLVLLGAFATELAVFSAGQAVAVLCTAAALWWASSPAVRDAIKVTGLVLLTALLTADLFAWGVIESVGACVTAGVLWALWREGDAILK